jgi:hypothetical protein
MTSPFTKEQFFEVFKQYNETVFPLQILFYVMAIAVVYMVFKPGGGNNRIISGLLAFLWIWMGLVYHIIFFTSINKAAYLFGVVFIQQGILFSDSWCIPGKTFF